jgi:hypothetical protein
MDSKLGKMTRREAQKKMPQFFPLMGIFKV